MNLQKLFEEATIEEAQELGRAAQGIGLSIPRAEGSTPSGASNPDNAPDVVVVPCTHCNDDHGEITLNGRLLCYPCAYHLANTGAVDMT